jgi:hypothetical protein
VPMTFRRLPLRFAFASRLAMGSLVFIAGVEACNLSDDDSGFGFFGGGGGSTGAVPTATAPPEKQSPCNYALEGYTCNSGGPSLCESGKNGNANCNDFLKCSGYQWELEPSARSAREAGACAQTCPTDPATPGAACEPPISNTLICEYQLTTCGCGRPATDGGIKKDGSTEGGVDAGASDAGKADAGKYVWTCVEPGPGCPRVRPRVGSPCVKPITCDYGACTFDDGLAVRCSGGYWLRDNSAFCPP